MKPEIWGIIFAAGQSTRMGAPKLMLNYKGKPIIQHSIDHALASNLDGVLVVANPHVSELINYLNQTKVGKVVINHQIHLGMSHSLKIGLHAIPKSADSAVILLGDQPLMSTSIINKIIDYYLDNNFPAVVQASFLGRHSHPVLFNRVFFKELSRIKGDQGGKSVVNQFSEQVHFVEMNQNKIGDIDTYSDYLQLLAE